MFCENCGATLQKGHKFCTKCGHSSVPVVQPPHYKPASIDFHGKWWLRFLNVVYIFLNILLIPIVLAVWGSNKSTYTGYGRIFGYQYEDTYGKAFWYSLLTIVIYVSILRLIKLAVLYISSGQKPEWKKEFKKLF